MTMAIANDDMVWKKSSYSGGQGGNCVEVATWRKASRSQGNSACVEVGAWRKAKRSTTGDNCVEAGTCSCHAIAVRDSKYPQAGTLELTPADWTTLLHAVSPNA